MAHANQPFQDPIKLVVVGDGGIGKTSMLSVFLTDTFPEKYTPTVFDNATKIVGGERGRVALSLWDTAGQEDYARLRPLSYPGADVVAICYSVERAESLSNIAKSWYPEVRGFCPNIPVILVGTKSDFRHYEEDDDDAAAAVQARLVPAADVATAAKAIEAAAAVECSARLGEGVEDVFQTAVDAVLDARGIPRPSKQWFWQRWLTKARRKRNNNNGCAIM